MAGPLVGLLLWAFLFPSVLAFPLGGSIFPLSGESPPWWKVKEVRFECTACGKCCLTKGDVMLNPQELSSAAGHKGVSIKDFTTAYGKGPAIEGWVTLKDRALPSGMRGCVLLEDDEKSCSIYEARPTQCSTYPWWPDPLKSPASWERESALAEDADGPGRRWSPELGGCEGISASAPAVEVAGIELNLEMYQAYRRRVPPAAIGAYEQQECWDIMPPTDPRDGDVE